MRNLLFTFLAMFFVSSQISVAQNCSPSGTCENLILNGDFENGNSGFTSGLSVLAGCGSGTYLVAPSALTKCQWWWPVLGHAPTPGFGNYMIVDGDASAPKTIYRTFVPVVDRLDYTFEFSLYPTFEAPSNATLPRPEIEVYINGTLQGTYSANGLPIQWNTFCMNYSANTDGLIEIKLVQTNFGGAGYDYGLDGLSFKSKICECKTAIVPDFIVSNCTVDFGPSIIGSVARNFEVLGVTWYFGDGSSSNSFNPVHSYERGGAYSAKVLAFGIDKTTGECCWSAKEFSLDVTDCNDQCAISISSIRATRINSPCTYEFTPNYFANLYIMHMAWDFGDGTTGTGPNPIHTYQSSGIYDVTVTMYGYAQGRCCEIQYVQQVNVNCSNSRISIPQESSKVMQEQKNSEFRLYPNPNNGNFSILPGNGTEEVKSIIIYDQNGKTIKSLDGKLAKEEIDLTEVSEGLYLIKIELSSGKYEIHKAVISK